MDIATVTDEALAILGLINSHHVWEDQYKRSKGKICQCKKNGSIPAEWNSNLKPLYTGVAGDKRARGKGWSKEGMKEYNKWCVFIARLRTQSPEASKNAWLSDKKYESDDEEESTGSEEIEIYDDTYLLTNQGFPSMAVQQAPNLPGQHVSTPPRRGPGESNSRTAYSYNSPQSSLTPNSSQETAVTPMFPV